MNDFYACLGDLNSETDILQFCNTKALIVNFLFSSKHVKVNAITNKHNNVYKVVHTVARGSVLRFGTILFIQQNTKRLYSFERGKILCKSPIL